MYSRAQTQRSVPRINEQHHHRAGIPTFDTRDRDGRERTVAFPPRTLSSRLRGGGFIYHEKDALGQRTQHRGDLLVHLFFDSDQLLASARSWGRTLAMVGGVYVILTNTSLFFTLLTIYSFVSRLN